MTSDENFYSKNIAKYYDIVTYYDYDKVADSFTSCIEGKHVLELGVGTGQVALRLAKLGFVVDGIDNSEPMLNAARRKLRKEKIDVRRRTRFYLQSASDIRLKGPYDAVISQGGVLAWVGPNIESYLKSKNITYSLLRRIYEILKKGGSLIISIQQVRPKVRKASFPDAMFYSGITKMKDNVLIVTHILQKNNKILAKQTFEKLVLTKSEFEKNVSGIGFKITGKNRSGLHYILTK